MDKKLNVNFEHYQYVLSMLGECTDDYIYIFDAVNDTCIISGNLLEVFGYEGTKFTNAIVMFQEIIHPDDFEFVINDIKATVMHLQNEHNCEYRCLDKNGVYRWISCRGKIVEGEDGQEYLIGQMKEIGKPHKIDNVTDLYRKPSFEKKFKDLVMDKEQSGFVMIVGVDGLKDINERLGYQTGNDVLRALADSIRKAIMPGMEVYRMDGDEISIYCHGNTTYQPRKIEQRIRKEIEKRIVRQRYDVFFTVSVGTMWIDDSTESWEDMMEKTEFAFKKARKSGKSVYYEFDDTDYEQHLRKSRIQDCLRKAVNNDFKGFQLYYQPIVNVEKDTVNSAEALIRWESDEFGFMLPSEFIPLLEESGLIIPLGKWVILTAMAQCKQWQEFIPDMTMNVNVSHVQLKKSDLVKDIMDCFENTNVDFSNICFEMTESGELESNVTIKSKFKSLSDSKVKLAIDDFGTGYSNLRYIKDMDFDVIKMDRLFIKGLEPESYEYKLVQHITKLAHNMHMKICYEGVETKDELSNLKELKPDFLQGFIFGKPMPAEEFEAKYITSEGGIIESIEKAG